MTPVKTAILIATFMYLFVLCRTWSNLNAGSTNVIDYWLMTAVAFIIAVGLVALPFFSYRKYLPRKQRNASTLIVFSFLVAGASYCALLFANEHFDNSQINYQTVTVLNKETHSYLTLSRYSHHARVPELRIAIGRANGATIVYPVDVDRALSDAVNVGDPIVIGVRKGALGFSYVASIEKANQ